MACSLELSVGAYAHTVLALLVNSIVNMTLQTLKQVLAEVKYSFSTWLSLFYPHSLLETKGVLAAFGGVDSTKIPGTDTSY